MQTHSRETGVEPTPTLREAALSHDPTGRYLDAWAEHLPLETETFDLVVSYLTLIDIDEIDAAIVGRKAQPCGIVR
jgi:hypothetical protein